MNEDEIIITLAKSKVMAKRIAQKAPVSQLERAVANLQTALNTIKKRDEAKIRKANLKKITAMIADMELSPNDITKAVNNTLSQKKTTVRHKTKSHSKKGGKIAPKYQIVIDGNTTQWTGRGRMPRPFQELLKQGGSLEQCLLQPKSSE